MEHSGHRKRLRERFQLHGLESLAPHEALELLLCYAIPRKDVNPIAHNLIAHFGSLHAVFEASEQALMEVDGIGEQAAVLLSMIPQLFRYYSLDSMGASPVLHHVQAACDYCRNLFIGTRDEVLYMLCLDSSGRLTRKVRLHEGTIDQIVVYPRKVVQAALQFSAAAVIFTHNHPSGIAEPSEQDIDMTQELISALDMISINVIDHVIVADGVGVSMRVKGFLSPPARKPAGSSKPQLQAAEDPSPVRLDQTKPTKKPKA